MGGLQVDLATASVASTRVTFPIDMRGEQDTKRRPVDRRSKEKFNVKKKKKKRERYMDG